MRLTLPMRPAGSAPKCTSGLALGVLLVACDGASPAREGSGEHGSAPFAVASGVTRADSGGDGRQHRVVPLRRMTGDVEILYGDPELPGKPFVMRIRELPGTMVPLHSHPVDEHITVVEGTLYFAVGDRWDRTALKKIEVGGYAFAPKGSTMFGYSPDGAVAQVHGVGPWALTYVNAADDPTKKGDAMKAGDAMKKGDTMKMGDAAKKGDAAPKK